MTTTEEQEQERLARWEEDRAIVRGEREHIIRLMLERASAKAGSGAADTLKEFAAELAADHSTDRRDRAYAIYLDFYTGGVLGGVMAIKPSTVEERAAAALGARDARHTTHVNLPQPRGAIVKELAKLLRMAAAG